jgi:hypothetical protein
MNLKPFDKKAIEMHLPDTLRQSQQQPVQQRVEPAYYSHPVNTIPPQVLNSSQQQGYPPQQPVYAIPQQSYRVVSQTYAPPPT